MSRRAAAEMSQGAKANVLKHQQKIGATSVNPFPQRPLPASSTAPATTYAQVRTCESFYLDAGYRDSSMTRGITFDALAKRG